jgi:hypothetical protein
MAMKPTDLQRMKASKIGGRMKLEREVDRAAAHQKFHCGSSV